MSRRPCVRPLKPQQKMDGAGARCTEGVRPVRPGETARHQHHRVTCVVCVNVCSVRVRVSVCGGYRESRFEHTRF
eukprot:6808207-Prymnesium_polylepis.1